MTKPPSERHLPKGPSRNRVALAMERIKAGTPGKLSPQDLRAVTISGAHLPPDLQQKVGEHQRIKEAEYVVYRRDWKRAGYAKNRERAIRNIRNAPAGRLRAKDLMVLRRVKGLPADVSEKIRAHQVIRRRENSDHYKKRQRTARVERAIAAVMAGVPGRLPRHALITLSSADGLPPAVEKKIQQHNEAKPAAKAAYMRDWHWNKSTLPKLQEQLHALDTDLRLFMVGQDGNIVAKYNRMLNDPSSKRELSCSQLDETEAKILLLRKRLTDRIDALRPLGYAVQKRSKA